MKFTLHRCHTNIHNTFSQIGLIALNILGLHLGGIKSGDNVNQNLIQENKSGSDKLEDEMIYDPLTLKRLKDLYKAKEIAIDKEDFDEAKKIKDAIDRLKSVSQQLIQLEERKRIAIKNERYDDAKILKYEIERLRNAVSGMNININMNNNNILNDKKNNMQNKNKKNNNNLYNNKEDENYYNNEHDK
jgi:centrosomal protein CEP104